MEAEFPVGISCAAEAKRRRCDPSTVWRERKGEDLPPYVRGVDGKIHRSRQLTYYQRRKRDKLIRQALELGWPVSMIIERMGVSNGVVCQVAKRTPNWRKVHRYSQRAWKDRLPATETG